MSNGMPWIRFHLYDWISGTNGMTSEQRGGLYNPSRLHV